MLLFLFKYTLTWKPKEESTKKLTINTRMLAVTSLQILSFLTAEKYETSKAQYTRSKILPVPRPYINIQCLSYLAITPQRGFICSIYFQFKMMQPSTSAGPAASLSLSIQICMIDKLTCNQIAHSILNDLTRNKQNTRLLGTTSQWSTPC